jgi:hypothetical protein
MDDNAGTLIGHGPAEAHLEINHHNFQKDESIEVSYSVLIVGEEQKHDDILQKVVTLVNV